MSTGDSLRWAWVGALVCFVLAGATGALYRFGLLYGLPADLQLGNVRHAHSHLMVFGWVTPALMALIATWLPRLTGRPPGRAMMWAIAGTFIAALLAYAPFLLYGYQVTLIGGKRLPLAIIAATLNILVWYGFILAYLRHTWRVPRNHAMRLWDAALLFMVLSSLGAFARAALVALKIRDPLWSSAAVHLFLELFSDGWFVLSLLGLLHAAHPALTGGRVRWGSRLIVVGLPVTFILALPVSQVDTWVRGVAGAGGIMVALGLLLHLIVLWPRVTTAWRVPLAFLALKATGLLGMSVPFIALWAERASLRVPYLHWLLLGFVTLGLVAAMQERGRFVPVWGSRWMMGTVLLVQLSLLLLTGLWPSALGGRWTLVVAAWVAPLPVLGAIGLLLVALPLPTVSTTWVRAAGWGAGAGGEYEEY